MDTPQQLALSCADLAREIAHGPALFDDRGKPTEAVERYNGSRLTQDIERCLLAGTLRLLRFSDRKIAAVLKCDVRSIALMVGEAERSGRIPAVKERLQALVAHNAEQSGIVLAELLGEAAAGRETLELAAMIKSVGGVNDFQVKNHQLLTGGATEIIQHIERAGEAERRAWALANSIDIEATTDPIDSDSTWNRAEPQQTLEIPPARHTHDTSAAAIPSPAAAGDHELATTRTPGGGVVLPPAGPESPTVSESSKF